MTSKITKKDGTITVKGKDGKITDNISTKGKKAPIARKTVSTAKRAVTSSSKGEYLELDKDSLKEIAKLAATYTSPDFAKRETDAARLDDLARYGNDEVTKAVAKNHNVGEDTLDYLARHGNDEVKYSVAKNHNTGEDTLDYLLGLEGAGKGKVNDVETLRKAKAYDLEVLQKIFLRTDKSPEMLRKIVYNKLMEKDDYTVAYILTRRELGQDLVEELSEYALEKVAYVDSTSNTVSRQTPEGDRGHMAIALASNPNASQRLLHRFSESPNYQVRYNAALNPNVALADAIRLAEDPNRSVSSAAKQTLKKQLGKRNFRIARHSPGPWGGLSGINDEATKY